MRNLISNSEFYPGELTIIFLLMIFEDLKIWKNKMRKKLANFSSFNPFPSLPSVATDDRKQFQCCNKVFNNKTRPLFFYIQLMILFYINQGTAIKTIIAVRKIKSNIKYTSEHNKEKEGNICQS